MAIDFHQEFNAMLPHVIAVRDAVSGSIAVKSKKYIYLPHPSQVEKSSHSQVARYKQYIAGAEFDSFPEKTLRTMIGKLKLDGAEVVIPPALNYLIDDVDNDGLSIYGSMRQCAENITQVKWQVLVADYQGLSDVDTSDISIEELSRLNARATIKQYNRENVVNWSFDRINGAMQLTFIMLREFGTVFNPNDFTHEEITSYLILALDEQGYYQQKIIESDDGIEYGERNYMRLGNQSMNWLPVVIASDGEVEAGSMPMELGFLSGITDLAYSRYIMSAEYKEAMRNLPPTTYTNGWEASDWETFKEINGRDYIATGSGAVNNLPGNVSVEIVGANTQLEGYERYFEANKKAIQSLGGVFSDDSGVAKTATQAKSESAENNAALMDIATGVEQAFKKAIEYCAMFENATGEINIEINKDFDAVKLTVEEVREIQNLLLSGLITQEKAIEMLVAGGWLSGEAEMLINELEENLSTSQNLVGDDNNMTE